MSIGWDWPRPDRTDWEQSAACRGIDPNLFHPTPITQYGAARQRPAKEQKDIAKAKAICATCPVGDDCQTAGKHDTMSIRNGQLPEERTPRLAGTCGSDAGYRAHYRRGDRGDEVCQACREAHIVARNEWLERRMVAS